VSNVQLSSASTAATVLGVSARDASCAVERGAFTCRLGALGPGETVDVTVQAESRVISSAGIVLGGRITLSVLAAGIAEEQLGNNRVALELATRRCKTSTPGAGQIRGSIFGDTICGRLGRDVIEAGDGRDLVQAGAGDDYVDVRDGERDEVRCGAGADRVLADAADVVAADCERTQRGARP
jgi:hypothetical protein